MFRALVWVVEQASFACVHVATCGQMSASLCALSYLMQSRWRYVLDVLCCHERDHTAESFGRCFGGEGAARSPEFCRALVASGYREVSAAQYGLSDL